jgi:dynein heavy chain
LESIFSAEDIQRQLPQESTKFKSVDKFWKDTLKKVRQSYRTAMEAFKIPNLLPSLKGANETLDQIQKSLEIYLETKRASFPRFYFLSDDELLSILSQTRNPEAVQEHLCKCFDAINRVTFTGKADIIDMNDMIKEKVPFVNPVQTSGQAVEKWLGDIEVKMVESLHHITKRCWQAYPEDGTNRKDWLFTDFASQSILAVDQIMWTTLGEEALTKIEGGDEHAMQANVDFTRRQLEDSVKIVRLDLTKLQRVMMGALIVLDVHGISVLENLTAAKTSSVNDFDWSKQLRYYWVLEDCPLSGGKTTSDDCVLKQTIAAMRYSFEYLGNTPRLVVTPLTDKCYMTLTGALHLNYGGAPAGPAGTGKTETTKDLGKALAVPVVVFNCSDGLDYKIMGRFFSGLAQAGAWACFDEFNRIQVEVLSVIAQQMLTVTHAIRARKEQFEFLGHEIPLNARFGVFITMNPGYAGRAELPDNLKSLFRPVAMMVPDYALIAEILLYSESFGNATQLARKMVNLYSLSSEQLSKQDHYDFGMRAVKSVLVMAGQLKRAFPDLPEDVTLIRALRDSNVPKFLSFDLPLFFGIITDLYPEAEVPYVDYGSLQKEIENQLRLARLQVVPQFVGKIIQLLETTLVRHGVMVVGLSQIGKSTNVSILSKALTQLRKDNSSDPAHQLTKIFSLNPKSITMQELYGSFNMNTGEWTDGLVAILVREAVMDSSDNKKWVVFDGPVDAIWIENMNTVLDDNKMLCLANGERIKLPPTVTNMFEVQDLRVASPATVSRCGMVYMEPSQLGWKPLITSWVERFKDKQPLYTDSLGKWCMEICEAALPFIREECKEAPGIPSEDANLVASFLRMLEAMVCPRHGFPAEDSQAAAQDGADGKPKPDKHLLALSKAYCVFAAVWSLGGNLHESSRQKFQDFLRGKVEKFCSDVRQFPDLYGVSVQDDKASFVPVSEIVPDFEFDVAVPFFNILVPTVETTLQRVLLENLMHAGYNVLFAGETGVGKSVGIQQFMNSPGESFAVASANFSAQTSSANIVDFLENRLERKRKNLLGAPPGTKMLISIDDINMPMLEKYGAQPPIELLRQVVDYRGFYDRKKLFWKAVADTQFIAACGPPGGGRMPVTPRFFRHFNMIWMTALPKDTMSRILSSILSGWLGVNSPEVQGLARPLVGATVDMFYAIVSDLLPTPVKCHYTFNLRDPAKMLQGMQMVHVETQLKDKKSLLRLWLHETCRSFRDRLINAEDRDWFNDKLMTNMQAHLGEKWSVSEFTDLVYGDFFERGEKIYIQSKSEQQVLQTFNEYLEEYNAVNPSKMNLVFFNDAQAHLSRTARIIRQQRGNALLVGVSGVGRKSIARMAAFMAEYVCSSIEITRNYGTNEFREDIKGMMTNMAKDGGKGLVFLFSDTQIVKESFLEDINNVLNTGEVPNLFLPDEVEQVIGLTRPLAKAAGKVDARDVIWQHFVQIIRESFHIVLAFSPVGEGFRARCRQFPSIINCATIDWYDPWPEDALVSVADRYYREVPKELGIEKMLGQLSQISCTIHASSSQAASSFYDKLRRQTYMTPTSYLELIKLFTELLGFKKGELDTKLNRYKVGASKLEYARKIVDQLQVDLTKLAPEIEQGKKDTAELIIKVDTEEAQAKEKEAAVQVDAKEAGQAAAEANEIKADCQKDLDEAMPEYNNAIKSLDALDKKDVQEVKSFKTPPELVATVLSAVCLLVGRKENSWDESKKFMNESTFLQQLREYDKDALASNVKLTQKLQKYVKMEQFVPETVKKVSAAAMSLCMWVRAMDIYARVARSIEPKKAKLAGAEESLAEAEGKLAVKKKELKQVQDKVAALQQQLSTAKSKATQLENQAEDCKVKLSRAEKLLAGLGNAAVSWVAASEVLEKDLKSVVGNITLAAGFIAYSGPFTAEFRHELTQQWLARAQEIDLDTDPQWKIAKVILDPAEIRQWNIATLPSDELSVENGILVTRGRRWPLMIDPQGQGNRWIKNMKKDSKLGVIKLSTPNFLRTLETGIREGAPILLENVEEVLDASLEPVLLKQVFKKGGQWLIRLGSEDVPYNSNFQFFITTKMGNPHYLPEICIKVTIINFTVTLAGLEDQLVVTVVANERPDLSELRDKLVVQIAADKAEMDSLEQLTLKLLASAKDDELLADDNLIQTLDKSKVTEAGCKERMASAEVSMVEINEVTEKLRPVAARASIIYFVVADLANIDPMYQYSLQFFVALFQQKLQSSEKDDDINKRIQILIDSFTEFAYVKICMGLFEDHKMLFSFLVTARILQHVVHAKFINKTPVGVEEWAYFLRGIDAGTGIVRSADEDPPPPVWMDAKAWRRFCVMEQLSVASGGDAFSGLTTDLLSSSEWQHFALQDAVHEAKLPGRWEEKLTPFQRMLVVKSLRENSLQLCVRRFVDNELGSLYTMSPAFDLLSSFKDSQKTTPIIFVLSSGADPTDSLVKFARDFEYEERLHFISLGQGQGEKAERLIKHGRESGDWVCLQNCHLAASWMPALERIQELQDADSTDDMYRLWLTAMPSPTFPVPVLQSGIKITNEPPKGLRANLSRTFQDISHEVYEGCTKSREFKKLLFGLAFFHAAILERRKFGPIGWNIPYEWMDSDFQVSREQVQMYLESQPGVPWITLTYIIAEVNYGGRVTDDKDVRLISAFLMRYFNEGLLEDGYKLSPVDMYYAPAEGSIEEVRKFVSGFPLDEDPQVFGLHSNALITAQTQSAKLFLDTIISVQPRTSSSGVGKSPEELVAEMASDFFDSTPKEMRKQDAHADTYAKTANGGVVSLGVFHGQELDRFNALIARVKSTLVSLGKAIKGLVVMSAELEEMYNSFLVQKLPPLWGEPVSYPCLKPLNSWFVDFQARIAFMNDWLVNGPPVSFWLPCFYFPQGFMTCSKQVHARKTKIPIDQLAFFSEPTKQRLKGPSSVEMPEDGVNVHGMFIQGAGWSDTDAIMVESEKAVLFVELPVIWLKVISLDEFVVINETAERYRCPVYKTSLRKGTLSTTGHSTNFVTYFQLPSMESDQGHWVRRGVALLCMLDE